MNPTVEKAPRDRLLRRRLAGYGAVVKWLCLLSIVLKRVLSPKLQNILSLLTMAIGAMALSATLFIGEGAIDRLWQDLDRLMGNRVIVYADAGPGQVLLKRRPNEAFTLEDIAYLKKHVPTARYIEPRFFGRVFARHRQKGEYMPVDGITGALQFEEAFTPVAGERFSENAIQGMVMECLLTRSAASVLGLSGSGGQTISVDDYRFTVVGMVEDPPEVDQRFRARVVLPFFWANLIWGRPNTMECLAVAWKNPRLMEETTQQLRKALEACRAPGAYHLSSSQFKIQKRKQIVSKFMLLGASQSLFCIVVASMGIVNVMLANVVRRMREFAIRVAMGAHQSDLVVMVLCESFLLGVLGASVGILAAIALSSPLSGLISTRIPEAAELQPLIHIKGIVLPLVVCGLSGLVAGVVPAIRARHLDILSVLRAE